MASVPHRKFSCGCSRSGARADVSAATPAAAARKALSQWSRASREQGGNGEEWREVLVTDRKMPSLQYAYQGRSVLSGADNEHMRRFGMQRRTELRSVGPRSAAARGAREHHAAPSREAKVRYNAFLDQFADPASTYAHRADDDDDALALYRHAAADDDLALYAWGRDAEPEEYASTLEDWAAQQNRQGDQYF